MGSVPWALFVPTDYPPCASVIRLRAFAIFSFSIVTRPHLSAVTVPD